MHQRKHVMHLSVSFVWHMVWYVLLNFVTIWLYVHTKVTVCVCVWCREYIHIKKETRLGMLMPHALLSCTLISRLRRCTESNTHQLTFHHFAIADLNTRTWGILQSLKLYCSFDQIMRMVPRHHSGSATGSWFLLTGCCKLCLDWWGIYFGMVGLP